jgi:hypothetical protein
MVNFRGGPINMEDFLRKIPIERGWDFLSVYLSTGKKYDELPIKTFCKGECGNLNIAMRNRENALYFINAGYSADCVLALKNSRRGRPIEIVSGDIQVFANLDYSTMSLKKYVEKEDLDFLNQVGFEVSHD